MSFSTTTAVSAPIESLHATNTQTGSVAAILMLAALAGAATTKAARRQYRQLLRKAAWKALGQKVKGFFNKKYRHDDTIAGLNVWVFVALVVLGAAIGFAIFGFTGFLILLGIGVIIYLLINK